MRSIQTDTTYSPPDQEIDQEVIDKICRKVIKEFKAKIKPGTIGDYDHHFNSYDELVYAYQRLGYSFDEINPYLKKCIYSLIDKYTEGTEINDLDIVFSRFLEFMDEHSQLRKIQKVYEKE